MLKENENIITKIEQQSKNKKRYSIYINGEYYIGISEDVLVRHSLGKGMKVTSHDLQNIVYDEEQSSANNYSLRLLSFRNRSEREIINKMKEKEYNEETIKNTISFLKQYKYIDDENFASDYVKSKMRTQKLGKIRLKQELLKKGVSKDIISTTIDELSDSDQQCQAALELATKKLQTTYKNDDTKSQYRKLGAFLQRKGFEYEIISKVLSELVVSS